MAMSSAFLSEAILAAFKAFSDISLPATIEERAKFKSDFSKFMSQAKPEHLTVTTIETQYHLTAFLDRLNRGQVATDQDERNHA